MAIGFTFLFFSSAYLDLFSDPEEFWGTVLTILIIVSPVFILRSFPSTGRQESEERESKVGKSELEKMSIRLRRGAEGYRYSQMLCHQDLKRTLKDRIRVRYRRSPELETTFQNKQGLRPLIENDELKTLLTTDYRNEFMSGSDRIKEEAGDPFKRHLARLIEAIEAME